MREKEKRYPKVHSKNYSFFERIAKAREDISSVPVEDYTEEAHAIAVSAIHELLLQLSTMTPNVRTQVLMELLKLVSWEDRALVTEVSKAIERAYEGNVPKCVAKKLADLRYDTGAL